MIAEEVSVQLGHLMLAVAVPVGTSKMTPAPGAAALRPGEAAGAAREPPGNQPRSCSGLCLFDYCSL